MDLAPIVLFVYNRPWHTRQTLEALYANHLADQSILIVYADGPKVGATEYDMAKIAEVRSIVKEKKWCYTVEVIESHQNLGLAQSIIKGVSEVLNKYGKTIVLEDDIVTSVGFLQYMNDALKRYESYKKVMHISGYMFPVKGILPKTFFYNSSSCWGWGTWKRAWDNLITDSKYLLSEIYNRGLLDKLNIDGTTNFQTQLEKNISGELKTWAIKWHGSICLNNGYCLHPNQSLTQNIGFDNSGIHCGNDNKYKIDRLAKKIPVNQIKIRSNKKVLKLIKKFNDTKRKDKIPFHYLNYHIGKFLPQRITRAIQEAINTEFRKKEIERKKIDLLPRFVPSNISLSFGQIKILDIMSFKFQYQEIFEKQIYKFRTLNPKPKIIDCGANLGLSIMYFKYQYPDSEIIGFEPDDEVFSVLQHNINQLKLKNITLIKKALWENETSLRFYSAGSDIGRFALENETEKIIEVDTDILSKYLNQEIDFLKIDIEGAELNVLMECKEYLCNVANIFVEFHSFTDKFQNLNQIIQILENSGFRLNVQSPGLVSPQPFIKRNTYLGMDMQLNIYGFRNYENSTH